MPGPGLEAHEAERLGRGGVDDLPDVDAHAVGEHRELVDERDVDRAEDVLQQLRQLGHLGRGDRHERRRRRARRPSSARSVHARREAADDLRRVARSCSRCGRGRRARARTRARSPRRPAGRTPPAAARGARASCRGTSSTRARRAGPRAITPASACAAPSSGPRSGSRLRFSGVGTQTRIASASCSSTARVVNSHPVEHGGERAPTGCPRCASGRRAGPRPCAASTSTPMTSLARLGERDGQRQADVAQSDDPDAHPDTVPSPSYAAIWPQRLRAHVRALAAADVPRDGRVERLRRDPSAAPSRAARGRAAESSRSTGASPAAAPGGAARTSSPPGQRCAQRLDDQPRPAARRPRPGRSSSSARSPRRRPPAARPAAGSPRAGRARAATAARPPGARTSSGSPASRGAHHVGARSRPRAVSPPPITLPARAVASGSPSAAVRGGDVLLRGLGGGVRVVAAERVVLARSGGPSRRCGSTCRS